MAMRAEARAWWAEVEGEHMRERIERRRIVAEQMASRRRRPVRRPIERVGGRPDRVASWAVALGCLLLLVAIASAHG